MQQHTIDFYRDILAEVSFPFRDLVLREEGDGLYLQVQYDEPDSVSGALSRQYGRKWVISRWMTKSEFLQTAFKACLTSMEHQTREWFRYKDTPIYGPHFDADDLVELAARGPRDVRPPSRWENATIHWRDVLHR